MEKKCGHCKEIKPLQDFYKSKRPYHHGYQNYCKECQEAARKKSNAKNPDKNYETRKARRLDLVDRVREWKRAQGCSCCPETEPVCLELHHLDPSEKEDQPSNLIRVSWDRFMAEARKCILLCSNCHKKYHAGLITLPSVAQPDQSTPFGTEGSQV